MDDRKWIHGIRRGDTRAFDALYGAYRKPVFRYACALSGAGSDAEDLLQETFLGLLRNIDRVDARRPLLPYLLQSVRNRHVDRLRAFENRRRSLPDAELVAGPASDPGGGSEEERMRAVSEALETLPEAQGEVVRLKVFGEMTYDGIAAHVGAPAATVRNRYRAALGKLREILGRSLKDA